MRAGGAGLVSGRSAAYPEVYAALAAALAAGDVDAAARHQRTLDRIVALGASIGRLKYALQLRGLGGTTARMTVDPPDASLCAAIATEVAALLSLFPVGCEPRLPVARHFFRGPAKAGRRASNWLGNRAGAGPQARRERGTGQLAGVSGAPGLIRCSAVRRAPGAPGR